MSDLPKEQFHESDYLNIETLIQKGICDPIDQHELQCDVFPNSQPCD